ncbi:hypothetical protein CYMTET_44090 [Cymbomonas tetramitiformis]|uniref:LysM domain-containing protein n=1 Tax=Cymbomonas tetramitiformis TaxID=36881 RepID=A0AAE0C2Z0_9CHLO|nr:hypothetical protein CYMTET_44090 [Cymbomonas tetramitiformis]
MSSQPSPRAGVRSAACAIPVERCLTASLANSTAALGTRGRLKPTKHFLVSPRKPSLHAPGSAVCQASANHVEDVPDLTQNAVTQLPLSAYHVEDVPDLTQNVVTQGEESLSSRVQPGQAGDTSPGLTFDAGYWKSTPLHPTPSRLYTFKEGENTWIVSGWLNKTVEELEELNPGVDLANVEPGQSIIVEQDIGPHLAHFQHLAEESPLPQKEHTVSIQAPPPAAPPPPSRGSGGSLVLALVCPTMAVAGFVAGKHLFKSGAFAKPRRHVGSGEPASLGTSKDLRLSTSERPKLETLEATTFPEPVTESISIQEVNTVAKMANSDDAVDGPNPMEDARELRKEFSRSQGERILLETQAFHHAKDAALTIVEEAAANRKLKLDTRLKEVMKKGEVLRYEMRRLQEEALESDLVQPSFSTEVLQDERTTVSEVSLQLEEVKAALQETDADIANHKSWLRILHDRAVKAKVAHEQYAKAVAAFKEAKCIVVAHTAEQFRELLAFEVREEPFVEVQKLWPEVYKLQHVLVTKTTAGELTVNEGAQLLHLEQRAIELRLALDHEATVVQALESYATAIEDGLRTRAMWSNLVQREAGSAQMDAVRRARVHSTKLRSAEKELQKIHGSLLEMRGDRDALLPPVTRMPNFRSNVVDWQQGGGEVGFGIIPSEAGETERIQRELAMKDKQLRAQAKRMRELDDAVEGQASDWEAVLQERQRAQRTFAAEKEAILGHVRELRSELQQSSKQMKAQEAVKGERDAMLEQVKELRQELEASGVQLADLKGRECKSLQEIEVVQLEKEGALARVSHLEEVFTEKESLRERQLQRKETQLQQVSDNMAKALETVERQHADVVQLKELRGKKLEAQRDHALAEVDAFNKEKEVVMAKVQRMTSSFQKEKVAVMAKVQRMSVSYGQRDVEAEARLLAKEEELRQVAEDMEAKLQVVEEKRLRAEERATKKERKLLAERDAALEQVEAFNKEKEFVMQKVENMQLDARKQEALNMSLKSQLEEAKVQQARLHQSGLGAQNRARSMLEQATRVQDEAREEALAMVQTVIEEKQEVMALAHQLQEDVQQKDEEMTKLKRRSQSLMDLQGKLSARKQQRSETLVQVQVLEDERDALLTQMKGLQLKLVDRLGLTDEDLEAASQQLARKGAELKEVTMTISDTLSAMAQEVVGTDEEADVCLFDALARVQQLEFEKMTVEVNLHELQANAAARHDAEESELGAAKKELEATRGELESVTQSLGGALADAEALVNREKRLRSSAAEEMAQLRDELQLVSSQSKAKVATLEKEKESLEAQVAQLRADMEAKIRIKAGLLEEASDDLAVKEAALQEVAATVASLEAAVETASEEQRAERDAMSGAQALQVTALEAQRAALEAQVAQVRAELEAREDLQRREMALAAQKLQQKEVELKEVAAALQAALGTVKQQGQKFQKEKALVMEKMARMRSVYESKEEAYCEELEAKKQELETVTAGMKAALEEVKTRSAVELAARDATLSATVAQVQMVQGEKQTLEAQITEIHRLAQAGVLKQQAKLAKRTRQLEEKDVELKELASTMAASIQAVTEEGAEKLLAQEALQEKTLVQLRTLVKEKEQLEACVRELQDARLVQDARQSQELDAKVVELKAKSTELQELTRTLNLALKEVTTQSEERLAERDVQLGKTAARIQALELERESLKAQVAGQKGSREESAEKAQELREVTLAMDAALQEVKAQSTEKLAEREAQLSEAVIKYQSLEAEKQAVEVEVQRLQGEMKEKEAAQTARIEAQAAQLEAKGSELEAVTAAMHAGLQEMEEKSSKKLASLDAELTKAVLQVQALEGERQALEERVSELHATVESKEQEAGRLAASARELTAKEGELKNVTQQMNVALEEVKQQSKEKLAEREAQMNEAVTKYQSLEQDQQKVLEAVKELQDEMRARDEIQAQQLEQKAMELAAKGHELRELTGAMNVTLETLKTQNAERLAVRESQLSSAVAQVQALEGERRELQAQVQELQGMLHGKEGLEKLEASQLALYAQELAAKETKLTQVTGAMNSALEEVKEQSAEKLAREAQMSEAVLKYQALEAEKLALDEQVQQLQSELQAQDLRQVRELEAKVTQLAAREEEVNSVLSRYEILEASMQAAEAQAEELRAQLEAQGAQHSAELDAKAAELKEKSAEMKQMTDTMAKAQAEELRAQLEAQGAQHSAELDAKAAELKDKSAEMKQMADTMKAALESVKGLSAERLAEKEARLLQAQAAAQALEAENRLVQMQLQESKRALEGASQGEAEKEEDIAAMEAKLKEMKASMGAALEAVERSSQEKLAAQEALVAEVREEARSLEAERQMAEALVEQLKAESAAKEKAQVELLQAKGSQLAAKSQELKKVSDTMSAALEMMQGETASRLAERDQELRRTVTQVQTLEGQKQALETELRALQETAAGQGSASAQQELSYRQELAAKGAQLKEVRAAMESALQEVKAQSSEKLAEREAQLSEAVDKYQALDTQKRGVEAELQRLQVEMSTKDALQAQQLQAKTLELTAKEKELKAMSVEMAAALEDMKTKGTRQLVEKDAQLAERVSQVLELEAQKQLLQLQMQSAEGMGRSQGGEAVQRLEQEEWELSVKEGELAEMSRAAGATPASVEEAREERMASKDTALQESVARVQALEAEKAELEAKVHRLQSQEGERAEEVRELAEKRAELEAVTAAINDALEEVKEQSAEKLAEREAQLSEAVQKYQSLEAEKHDLQDQVTALQAEMQEKDSLQAEELEEMSAELSAKSEELQQMTSAMNTALETVRNQSAAQLAEREAELSEIVEEYQALVRDTHFVEDQMQLLSAEMTMKEIVLEEQLAAKTLELDVKTQEMQGMAAMMNSALARVQAQGAETVAERDARLSQAVSQVQALEEEKGALELEVQRLSMTGDMNTQELETTEAKLKDVNAAMDAALEDVRTQSEERLAQRDAQLSEARDQVQKLEAESTTLEQQVKNLHAILQGKDALDELEHEETLREHSALEAQLKQVMMAMDDAVEKVKEQSRLKLAEKESQAAEIVVKYQALESEKRSMEETLRQLQREMQTRSEVQARQLQSKSEELAAKSAELKEVQAEMDSALAAARAQSEERLAERDARLGKAVARAEELEAERNASRERIRELQAGVEAQETRQVEELAAMAEELRAKDEELQQGISEMSRAMMQVMEPSSGWQAAAASAGGQVRQEEGLRRAVTSYQALLADKQAIQLQVEHLEGELAVNNKLQAMQVQAKTQELVARSRELRQVTAAMSAALEEVKRQNVKRLAARDQQLTRTVQRVRALEGERKALQTQMKELQVALQAPGSTKTSMAGELKAKEARLSEVAAALKLALEEMKDQSAAKVQQQEEMLVESLGEIRSLEAERVSVEAHVAQLRGEVAQLQGERQQKDATQAAQLLEKKQELEAKSQELEEVTGLMKAALDTVRTQSMEQLAEREVRLGEALARIEVLEEEKQKVESQVRELRGATEARGSAERQLRIVQGEKQELQAQMEAELEEKDRAMESMMSRSESELAAFRKEKAAVMQRVDRMQQDYDTQEQEHAKEKEAVMQKVMRLQQESRRLQEDSQRKEAVAAEEKAAVMLKVERMADQLQRQEVDQAREIEEKEQALAEMAARMRTEKAQAAQKVKSLEAEMEQKETRLMEDIQLQAEELRQSSAEMMASLRQAREQAAELEREKETKLGEALGRYQALEAEKRDLEEQVRGLQTKMQYKQVLLNESAEAREMEVTAKAQELELVSAAMKAALEDVQTRSAERLKESDTQVTQLETQVQSLQAEAAEQKSSQADALQEKEQALVAKEAELRKTNDKMHALVEELSTQSQAELEGRDAQVAELKTQVQAMQVEAAELETQVQSLQAEAAEQESSQADALQEKEQALVAKEVELRKTNDKMHALVEELNTQSQAELEGRDAQVAELTTRFQALEAEKGTLQQQLQELRSEAGSKESLLSEQLEAKSQELVKKGVELQEVREAMGAALEEVQEQSAVKLAEQEAVLAASVAEVRELAQLKSSYTKLLADLQEEMTATSAVQEAALAATEEELSAKEEAVRELDARIAATEAQGLALGEEREAAVREALAAVEALEAEKGALEEEVQRVQADMQELAKTEMAVFEEEKQKMARRVEEMRKAHQLKEAEQVAQLEAKEAELQDVTAAMQDALEQAQAEAQGQEAQLRRGVEMYGSLEEAKATLAAELERERGEMKAERGRLVSEVWAREEELASMTAAMDSAAQSMEELRGNQFEELRRQKEQVVEDMLLLTEQFEAREAAQLEQLEQKEAELEEALMSAAALSSDVSASAMRLQRAAQLEQALQQQAEASKAELDAAQGRVAELEQEQQSALQEMHLLRQGLEVEDASGNHFTVYSLTSEREALREEVGHLQAAVQAILDARAQEVAETKLALEAKETELQEVTVAMQAELMSAMGLAEEEAQRAAEALEARRQAQEEAAAWEAKWQETLELSRALEAEETDLMEQIQKLQRQMVQREEELLGQQRELLAAKAEEAKEARAGAEAAEAKYTQELAARDAELDEATTAMKASLAASEQAHQGTLHDLETQLTAAAKHAEAVESERDQISAQLAHVEAEARSAGGALTQQLEEKEEELRLKQLELVDVTENMARAMAAEAERVEELDRQQALREQDLAKVAGLQGAMEELEQEIAQAREELAEKGRLQEEQMEEKAQEMAMREDQLQRVTAAMKSTIKELHQSNAAAVEEKDAELRDTVTKVRQLEAQKHDAEQALRELRSDLDAVVVSQGDELEVKARQLSAKEAELKEVTAAMEEVLQAAQSQSPQEVAERMRQLTKAEKRVQGLKEMVLAAQAQMTELEARHQQEQQEMQGEVAAFTKEKQIVMKKVARMQEDFSKKEAAAQEEKAAVMYKIQRMEEEFEAQLAKQTEEKASIERTVQSMEAEFEAQLAKQTEEKASIERTVQSMEEEFLLAESAQAEELQMKEAEVQRLRVDLSEDGRRAEDAVASLQVKEAELKEVTETMNDMLESMRAKSEKRLMEREAELKSSLAESAALEAQKGALEQQVEQMGRAAQEGAEEQEAQITAKAEELSAKEAELVEMTAMANDALQELKARGAAREVERGAEQLEKASLVEALEAETHALEAQMRQLEEMAQEERKRQNALLKEKEELLQVKEAEHVAVMDQMNARMAEMEERDADLLAEQEMQLQKAVGALRKLGAERDALEERLGRLIGEMQAEEGLTAAQRDLFKAEVLEKEAHLAKLTEVMEDALQEVRAQSEEQLEEREAQLARAVAAAESLERDKANLEKQVAALAEELTGRDALKAEALDTKQAELQATELELSEVTEALRDRLAAAEGLVALKDEQLEQAAELERLAQTEIRSWQAKSTAALQKAQGLEVEKERLFHQLLELQKSAEPSSASFQEREAQLQERLEALTEDMSSTLAYMDVLAADETQMRVWANTELAQLSGEMATGAGLGDQRYNAMRWAEGRVMQAARRLTAHAERRERFERDLCDADAEDLVEAPTLMEEHERAQAQRRDELEQLALAEAGQLQERNLSALVLAQTLQGAREALVGSARQGAEGNEWQAQAQQLEAQQLAEAVHTALEVAQEATLVRIQQAACVAGELGELHGDRTLAQVPGQQGWWRHGGTALAEEEDASEAQAAAEQRELQLLQVCELEMLKQGIERELEDLRARLQHGPEEEMEACGLQLGRKEEELKELAARLQRALASAVEAALEEAEALDSRATGLVRLQAVLQSVTRARAETLAAAAEDTPSEWLAAAKSRVVRAVDVLGATIMEAEAMDDLRECQLELKQAELVWLQGEAEAASALLLALRESEAEAQARLASLQPSSMVLRKELQRVQRAVQSSGSEAGDELLHALALATEREKEMESVQVASQKEVEEIAAEVTSVQAQALELASDARAALLQCHVLQVEVQASRRERRERTRDWEARMEGIVPLSRRLPAVMVDKPKAQAEEMEWHQQRMVTEMEAGQTHLQEAVQVAALIAERAEKNLLPLVDSEMQDAIAHAVQAASVEQAAGGDSGRVDMQEMRAQIRGASEATLALEDLQARYLDGRREEYARLAERLDRAEKIVAELEVALGAQAGGFVQDPDVMAARNQLRLARDKVSQLRAGVKAVEAQLQAGAQQQVVLQEGRLAMDSRLTQVEGQLEDVCAAIRRVEARVSEAATVRALILEAAHNRNRQFRQTAERVRALEVVVGTLRKRAQDMEEDGAGQVIASPSGTTAVPGGGSKYTEVLEALAVVEAETEQLAALANVQMVERDAAVARAQALEQLEELADRHLTSVQARVAGACAAVAQLSELARASSSAIHRDMSADDELGTSDAAGAASSPLAMQARQVARLQQELTATQRSMADTQKAVRDMLQAAGEKVRQSQEEKRELARRTQEVESLRMQLQEARGGASKLRARRKLQQESMELHREMCVNSKDGDATATPSSDPAVLKFAVEASHRIDPRVQIKTEFAMHYAADYGVQMMLVTSADRWDPQKGHLMEWGTGHRWSLHMTFASGTVVQYKYITVRVHDSGWVEPLRWQQGNNRVLTLPTRDFYHGETVVCNDVWDACPLLGRVETVGEDGSLSYLIESGGGYFYDEPDVVEDQAKQLEDLLSWASTNPLRTALALLGQDPSADSEGAAV